MLKLPTINLKRLRTFVVAMLFIALQFPVFAFVPQKVYADGTGSPEACLDSTANVLGSETGSPSTVTVNLATEAGVPAGSTVTGVCIKSGDKTTFVNGSEGHSPVITTNGSYGTRTDKNLTPCYSVTGIGTSSTTVTRLNEQCQEISHIDVVYAAPQDVCPLVDGVQTDPAQCDVCPLVAGVQSTTAECDVCPLVAGTQSTLAECDVCPLVAGTQSTLAECDVCPNVDGVQNDASECDVCPLVAGPQSTLAECDVCPLVAGTQSTLAECDVCPNVAGEQSTTAECDVCPNVAGEQSSVEQCEEPEEKGSITIIKEAKPDTDEKFDFTATGDDVSDFTLGDEESKTFEDLSEGEYSFTEEEHETWELKKIKCYYTPIFLFQSIENDIVLGPDVDIDGNTVTVDLGEGENVTCKFVNEPGKVGLCHATGSENNPFVKITISAAGAFNGHLGGGNGNHQGAEDIIPPFEYKGETYFQNWPSGEAIYDNGCVVPEEEPETPVAVVTLEPCTEDSGNNDNVIVSVTNTDDDTDETVTYTVNLGGQTKELTLEDGETDIVTFTGLAEGSYSATVTGDDGTEATSNSAIVKNCPEEGDILGETLTGGQGSGTILADTGSDILGTIFAALALIGLTCSLAVPSFRAQYE